MTTNDETTTESCPEEIRDLLDERFPEWSYEPIRGDASTRQYGRARGAGGETCVVAYYPLEVRSKLDQFLAAYEMLAGVAPVPELIATSHCGVLQHDVGDTPLTAILRDDPMRGRRLVQNAIDQLALIQTCEPDATFPNPPFDAQFFLNEMEMTNEFYVRRLMGRPESVSRLSAFFAELANNLTSHPYVLCHRDYHGDNLQVQGDDLWILDFQDMRLGPDTYDLASLLRDRGVVNLIGKEVEERLLRYYARQVGAEDDIRMRYWETLLQRSIKITGTFARQAVERERHHYLDHIPPAIESIIDCIDHLPVYQSMRDVFPIDFARRGETT